MAERKNKHRSKAPEAPAEDPQEVAIRRRAVWSGTITFGLVNLPVDLFPATRPRSVSLRMVDRDGAPLNRRYFCPSQKRPVERDEIVRGYEVDKDQFVVVGDDELEDLAPKKSREIDLRRFVDAAQIDPMYFQRTYVMVPSTESTKAYRLLAETMQRANRVGVATFVMRGKEYLVALIAEGGILRAQTLRFHDELRTPEDVGLPTPAAADANRVKSMVRALERLEADALDPAALSDRYAARLLDLIKRKQDAGEDLVPVSEREADPEDAEEAEVIDLMEVLKRRLGSGERTPAAARQTAPQPASNEAAAAKRPRSGTSTKKRAAPRKAPRRDTPTLDDTSKAELYERAKALDIPHRSAMTKQQLLEAIRKAS